VESRELSNLYIDLSESILRKIEFNSSSKDTHNQLLYLSCVENGLSNLADEVHNQFIDEIEPINEFNFKRKWIELQNISSVAHVIKKEFEAEGLISILEDSIKKIVETADENLIATNNPNNLKKFRMILDKYRLLSDLLRKLLHEC
tara:strand:+ start:394 stop:831 length:438 start_codon:yes stop_codon:yes gene_type:complete